MTSNQLAKMITMHEENFELQDEDFQAIKLKTPQINPKPRLISQLNNLHKKNNRILKRNSSLLKKQPGTLITRGAVSKALDEGEYQWQSKANIKIRGKRNFQGLLDGPVQIIHNNGFYFKGQYKFGIRINGFIKFENGFTYKGQLFNDQIKGFGILTFPSGKIVTGEWQNGYVEENARIDYPTGQIYYGSLQQLKKHGQGHLFFTDGSKYSGVSRKDIQVGMDSITKMVCLLREGYGMMEQQIIDQEISQKKVHRLAQNFSLSQLTMIKLLSIDIKYNHQISVI